MSQAGEINVVQNHPEIPTQFDADVGFAVPVANILNIFGAGGTTTSASGNTVTITSSGGSSFTWNSISASQTLVINNGYFCAGGGALSLALPATSTLGDEIIITLDGSTSFTITQGAGQSIRLGNLATTAGVGGSVTSTQQGDTIWLVCQTANLKWNAIDSMGNPIIV